MAHERGDDIDWWWHAETGYGFPLMSSQRPIKLPKSRSVENLMASAGRSPTPAQTGNFEDEVDFGGSEPSSPHPTECEEEKSRNSSQRLSRARDRLTSELPLKYQNRWPPKVLSWSVKPSRKSMLDWSLC